MAKARGCCGAWAPLGFLCDKISLTLGTPPFKGPPRFQRVYSVSEKKEDLGFPGYPRAAFADNRMFHVTPKSTS